MTVVLHENKEEEEEEEKEEEEEEKNELWKRRKQLKAMFSLLLHKSNWTLNDLQSVRFSRIGWFSLR